MANIKEKLHRFLSPKEQEVMQMGQRLDALRKDELFGQLLTYLEAEYVEDVKRAKTDEELRFAQAKLRCLEDVGVAVVAAAEEARQLAEDAGLLESTANLM